MSRRRYLSSEISISSKLPKVSRLAIILYTWGIPHAGDDCRISAKNSEECRLLIIPGVSCSDDEVEKAVDELISVALWGRDEDGRFFYPAKTFYKWQSYINSINRRETPQIAASLSSSSSSSLKEEKNPPTPLPDWLPSGAWLDYLEHRKKKRAPNTERAKQLAIGALAKLKDGGNDPTAVINQSILNGWTGLFEIRATNNGAKPSDLTERIRRAAEVKLG